jgi:hypothetical protein
MNHGVEKVKGRRALLVRVSLFPYERRAYLQRVSHCYESETLISLARLLSTGSHTVYKFSPISPTRDNAHQLLNPRQS